MLRRIIHWAVIFQIQPAYACTRALLLAVLTNFVSGIIAVLLRNYDKMASGHGADLRTSGCGLTSGTNDYDITVTGRPTQ